MWPSPKLPTSSAPLNLPKPAGASATAQDAAVEGDHAGRSGSYFEQIHDGEVPGTSPAGRERGR